MRVLFVASWALPLTVLASASLRSWITAPLLDSLPGVNILTALCLLAGPLSWPYFTSLRPVERAQAVTAALRRYELQARSGTFFDAWTLSKMVSLSHGRKRLRLEFLVFPLGSFTPILLIGFPLLGTLVLLLWFGLLGDTLQFQNFLNEISFPAVILFSSWAFAPLFVPFSDATGLSRALLLPGQPGRAEMPHWLLRRQLPLWLGGAGFIFLILAGWALWFGVQPFILGMYCVLLLWGVCTAATLTFWRFPVRSGRRGLDPVLLVAMFFFMLLFLLAGPLFFSAFRPWVCLATMALAFVIPLALYRLGLKRWRGMEYGA